MSREEDQSDSLLVTWKYEDNDYEHQGDYERDVLMLTSSSPSSSARSSSNRMTTNDTPRRGIWGRLSKRISNYWEEQQQRQQARPDNLEYDFVAPSEKARKAIPHRYDEKTVRLAADGDYYLRNRYKQKV